MQEIDAIRYSSKIIHRIMNIYTSEMELLDSSRIDEFYISNMLPLAITYNKSGEVIAKRTLQFYSKSCERYKTIDKVGDEKIVGFEEVCWNEDKSIFTIKLYNENFNEESTDICRYSGQRLIEQTLVTDSEKIVIKHFYDANGKIVLSEEFCNGEKTVITKHIKERKGKKVIRFDGNEKMLDAIYQEFDQFGRVILTIDYNEKNKKVGKAKFAYNRYGEKIMESFTGGTTNIYVKRFYKYGEPEEMIYIENTYKFSEQT